MLVSIVYCTARKGGFDILDACLSQQTYQNFELVIVDELNREPYNFKYLKAKVVNVVPPPKKPKMFWNLNASMNAAVKASQGQLIVLLQDYIWVPSQGVHKFVNKAHEEWPCLISGIGHQYKDPSQVWPEGEVIEPSGERTFIDPRSTKSGFYLCNPVEWEANWSCFSQEVWETIGGFDEDFDAGWGYDNVNFSERAQLAGYNVFLDTNNEIKGYDHIGIFGEREHRDSSPNNQKLWYNKYRDLHKGSKQWKLDYNKREI